MYPSPTRHHPAWEGWSCDRFFEQGRVQQFIVTYLQTLPDTETDPEILQSKSKEVLKSIERQHGLLVERTQEIYLLKKSRNAIGNQTYERKCISEAFPKGDRLRLKVIRCVRLPIEVTLLLSIVRSHTEDEPTCPKCPKN